MAKKKNFFEQFFFWALLVGGLNWGLVGLFDFNLVTSIFGSGSFTTIIYVLVAIGAVWQMWNKLMKK